MLWARPGENLGFFPRLTKFVKQPGKIRNDQVTKTTIIKIACFLRMNLEINFHGKGSFTIIQKDPFNNIFYHKLFRSDNKIIYLLKFFKTENN